MGVYTEAELDYLAAQYLMRFCHRVFDRQA